MALLTDYEVILQKYNQFEFLAMAALTFHVKFHGKFF